MVIGFWRAWALVVGMMIGSGIFTLPTLLAPYGGYSFVAWGLTAVGALSLVFSISYMASRKARAGGPQAYVFDAFGLIPAMIVAWGYWVSLVVAVAAIALSLVGYLEVFVPLVNSSPMLTTVTAIGIIWAFTAVSWLGTQQASFLQLVTTWLKIIPLLLIGLLGLTLGDVSTITAAEPPEQAVLPMLAGIMLLIMWAYIGIEAASIPAGETRDPERTIPLALFWGTLSATAVYVIALAGVMAVIPLAQLAESPHPFVDAAQVLLGGWGEIVIGLGALFAIGGALNACVFLSGSIPATGANEGLFPRAMSQHRGSSENSPKPALLLASFIATALVLSNSSKGLVGSFELMILISTFSALIVYWGASLAGVKFSWQDLRTAQAVNSKPLWALLSSLLGVLFSSAALYGAWTLYFL